MKMDEFIEKSQGMAAIDAYCKSRQVFKSGEKALVSISGGSDSDIMLDLLLKCERPDGMEFIFVWFDTGFEYNATKDHLAFLENKYGIKIQRIKAIKSIPYCVKQNGVPFLSKLISGNIERLQRHGFKWENEPFEELIKKYPNCKAALRWWCDEWGEESRFSIKAHKWLKEFMIENPPDFPISASCCTYAKKKVAEQALKDSNADLNIYGVRRLEGGARASAYKSCFTSSAESKKRGVAEWRPLFWFNDEDKRIYENDFGVTHSKCYTEYGMKRTGCVGCPFNRKIEDELQIIQKYEPHLYKAAINIFGRSYEYTKKYREFQKRMTEAEKNGFLQLQLFPDA